MTFAETTIEDFVGGLAAGEATPGGGAATAIVGATGAGLVEMVCNLTIGREAHADVEDQLVEIRADLQDHRARLLELADEDAAAIDAVMAAYGSSEDEGRADAIETASKGATEVPLETADACLAVLEDAVAVTEVGNENAVTDGGTGALLVHAALQAALNNVAVNLGSIEDEAFVAEAGERADEMETRADEALASVRGTGQS